MKKVQHIAMKTIFSGFLCFSLFPVCVQAATVPMEMQPGTEIIYDEEGKPSIVKGGVKDFTQWQGLDGKTYTVQIPKDIPVAEQM